MRWTSLALSAALTAGALPVMPAAAQTKPHSKPKQQPAQAPVTLNFVNADIDAVSRAMAAILDRQIVVDPRVKGTITLYSEQPLSPREAYLNYLAGLRGLGFSVVEVAGILKVVPEADAKLQTGTVSVGSVTRSGDQILTQIFRLQHENANNLVTVLRPLISPNNTINANPGTNSLVITDYADNLQRIARIIAALDMPSSTDVEVIPVQNASAVDLAPLVQRLADSAAGPGAPGLTPVGGGGALSVIGDARTNTLLVKAPNAQRLNAVRELVAKLDRPISGTGAGGNIYVVYLKNADATKLAQILRAAFSSTGGSSAGGGPGLAQTVATAPQQQAGAAGQSTMGTSSPQATAPVQASAGPSTGGFIQADPSTNSLIITAAEPLYRQMRAVIDQLDSRRAQVYLEALIVEIQGDNAANFGVQWLGASGKNGDSNIPFAVTNFGSSGNIIGINAAARTDPTTLASAVGEGLSIGVVHNFAGTYALSAIAQALQSQTKTNILSTPNQVTLDNEEAKIVVGQNVPFITGQFTNTGTGTTNPFQTIERKDVGLTLRVRPQIGEGGTVRLTIFLESSDVVSQVAPGTSNAGPSTTKRSIESTVVVDDGQVLALGGLVQDRFIENNTKVPLLGDIPLIGRLFRSESRTKNRTNLMVFLRPVIMRDGETANRLSVDRYDMIRAQQVDNQPEPSLLLPLSGSPVLPPRQPAGQPATGASAPAAGASAPPAPLTLPASTPASTPAAAPPPATPAAPVVATPVPAPASAPAPATKP